MRFIFTPNDEQAEYRDFLGRTLGRQPIQGKIVDDETYDLYLVNVECTTYRGPRGRVLVYHSLNSRLVIVQLKY